MMEYNILNQMGDGINRIMFLKFNSMIELKINIVKNIIYQLFVFHIQNMKLYVYRIYYYE